MTSRRYVSSWLMWAASALLLSLIGGGVHSAAAPVTLTVWLTDHNADTQALLDHRLIPQFEAAHPDVHVEMNYISWDDYTNKLLVALAAGTMPDIFTGGASFRGPFAEQHLARPIDDLVKGWSEVDDFYPGAWDGIVWKGRPYGVPYLAAPRTLMYRADLLSEAGLDADSPPTEWEDVMRAATKMTKADSQGRVTQVGLSVPPSDFTFWLPLLYQAGGHFVSDDGNTPLFNTPEGDEAANYYLDLYKQMHRFGDAPAGDLASGTAAMVYSNASTIRSAQKSNPRFAQDIRVAPPMQHQEQVALVYIDWLAISTQTKHPGQAFDLIKWLVSPDNLVAYNGTFFFIPPRRSTLSSAFVQNNQAISQMMQAVMPFGVPFPSYNYSPNRTRFEAAWKQVIAGRYSPRQALEEATQEFVGLSDAVTQ